MNPEEEQSPLLGNTPADPAANLPNLGEAPAPVAPEAIPMGAIPAGAMMGAIPAEALNQEAPIPTAAEASDVSTDEIPVSSSIQTKPTTFSPESSSESAAPQVEAAPVTVEAPAAMPAPEAAVEAPDLSQLTADLTNAAASGNLESPIEETPAQESTNDTASLVESTPQADLGGDIPAPEIPEGGKLTLAPLSPTEETPVAEEQPQEILIGQPLDAQAAPAETEDNAVGVQGVAKAATAGSEPQTFDPIALDPVAVMSAESTESQLQPVEPTVDQPAGLQPIMQEDGSTVAVPDVEPTAPAPTAPEPGSLAAAIAEDEAMYSATGALIDTAPTEVPEEVETLKPEENDGAIKPANPVPGSIGSAFAYSESAPDHSSKVVLRKYKAPKQQLSAEESLKNKKMLIIIGAVVAAVVIIVLVILLISSGSSKTTTQTTDNNATFSEPEFSSITCTMKISEAKLNDYGAMSGDSKILITFYGGEFYDATLGQVLSYSDEEAANNGKSVVRSEYMRDYSSHDLNGDPFESRYSVSGSILTVTHYADEKTMTSKTAPVFNFTVDEEGQAMLDEDSIKSAYGKLGYTCNGGSSK